MTASTRFGAVLGLALLLALYTSAAIADEGAPANPIVTPSPTEPTSSSATGDSAGDSTGDSTDYTTSYSEQWSYSTYYLYPLTRHMGESGINGPWRYALYPVTAVLDTAQLPWGALAGLFGE